MSVHIFSSSCKVVVRFLAASQRRSVTLWTDRAVLCRPLIVIGGASDAPLEGTGAFQEWPQVEACRQYCKYAARPASAQLVPYHVMRAVKETTYGRPGSVTWMIIVFQEQF